MTHSAGPVVSDTKNNEYFQFNFYLQSIEMALVVGDDWSCYHD